MRTASRRARRLAGLLLLAAAVCWAFVRRRANAVRWVEPPATILPSGGAPTGAMPAGETGERAGVPVEPGAPGEIPDDILATDAGLTELPEAAADEGRADTVDETRVAEILADSAGDVVVVDETTYEQAIAGAAPEPPAAPPEHVDRAAAGPAVAEPAATGPAGEADLEAEVVATGPAAAAPSEGTSEAELEAAAPSAAEEEPTGAEPPAAAPSEVVADGESTGAGLGAGAPSEVVADGAPTGAGLAAADEEPTEPELASPAVEESTASIRPEVDEATGRGIPLPTFSEAPTAEIPIVSDDLQAIRGIGPSMERKLHGLGIVSYRQLALLDGAELERVRAELTDFRGRIEREDWVGQARTLHREKYGRDPS